LLGGEEGGEGEGEHEGVVGGAEGGGDEEVLDVGEFQDGDLH
jgi:hypothetical protein